MVGIYKITNCVTNLSYIGQSINIKERIKQHFKHAELDTDKSPEWTKALYVAMRKYGIENFQVTILESGIKRELLDEREIYWIAYYDSYNNGYNETKGGRGCQGLAGEMHPKHKLTLQDVRDIRYRYAACVESVHQIFMDYSNKIKRSGFKKIYTWQTWKNILPELDTEAAKCWHNSKAKTLYGSSGESNPRSILTEQQVKDIRKRYELGESVAAIHLDYKQFGVTYQCIKLVASRATWKDIE